MIHTWLIKSYFKTKQKMEWLVVPLIVILAFALGLLQAVFLGLAISTFLFVASFYRSGVVKYVASGSTLRSSIERRSDEASWLDRQGDRIQMIVLQNYLFFGNASSILSYIDSMFEDPPEGVDPLIVPPTPDIVIVDLALVTGMDTSAVDAFKDMLAICESFECKLFLAGMSEELRQVMQLGGVSPDLSQVRSERKLRFFSSLDTAVGKAEDLLVSTSDDANWQGYSGCTGPNGFVSALRCIDEQVRRWRREEARCLFQSICFRFS